MDNGLIIMLGTRYRHDYDQIIHSYNKEEVEEVFTIPIEWLLNYEPYMHVVSVEPVPSPNFPYEKIMNGTQYQWRARSMEEWFFDYEKYTIWGLTARILKTLYRNHKVSDTCKLVEVGIMKINKPYLVPLR